MKHILAAVLILLSSACASEKINTSKEIDKVDSECLLAMKAKKINTMAAYMDCRNNQVLAIAERAELENLDIIKLNFAKRRILAEKLDNKEITKSEFEVGIAENDVQATNYLNIRQRY